MSKVVSKNVSRRENRRARQRRQTQIQRLLPFILIGIGAVIILGVLIIPSLAKGTTDTSQAHGTTLGNTNAPVQVIEFGDYQCPACAAFFSQDQPTLIKNYVDPGKISFTFVPFSFIGAESIAAAQAAYCAGDQGKYWQYHDQLYNDQHGENQGYFSTSRLEGYAQTIGLNMDQFKQCFEGGKYKDKVQSDYNYAVSKNVNSTPSFLVDGQLVDPSSLFQTIDNAIKAKGQ
jgi:protein-disulfide isomerase